MPRLVRLSTYLKQLNPVAIVAELLIVFVGVYLAFMLAEYRETRRLEDRKDRVIALLHEGVGRYETLFSGFVLWHDQHNAALREALQNGDLPDYSDQFYVAPQYPIDVISYVLTSESFDVFDLDLYIPLTEYASRMQRIMYVEAQITDLADRYVSVPREESPEYAWRVAQQRQQAWRYLQYMESRKRIAAELAEHSRGLADLLARADI